MSVGDIVCLIDTSVEFKWMESNFIFTARSIKEENKIEVKYKIDEINIITC